MYSILPEKSLELGAGAAVRLPRGGKGSPDWRVIRLGGGRPTWQLLLKNRQASKLFLTIVQDNEPQHRTTYLRKSEAILPDSISMSKTITGDVTNIGIVSRRVNSRRGRGQASSNEI